MAKDKKRKCSKTKESSSKGKKQERKFIYKTIIDALLAGLIAIGVFLGRPPNPQPAESYGILLILLACILFLISFYTLKFGERRKAIGIFIAVVISVIEVLLIGIIFSESLESIYITMFIVFPSVLIFDKLLG